MTLKSSNMALMYPAGVLGLASAMADGFYEDGAYPDAIDPDNASLDRVIKLGQTGGTRDRSVLVDTLFTTGNDNDAFDVHVHLVELLSAAIGLRKVNGIRTRKIGTIAVVACTGAKDGTFVPDTVGEDTVRVIDTITSFTATAFGTALFTALGGPLTEGANAATPVLSSPADNTNPASLLLPDVGGSFGVFLEPAGEGRYLNGLVRRYT
jgi:hypothetical protein